MTAVLSFLAKVPLWVWLVVAVLMWGGWQQHRAKATAAAFKQEQMLAAEDREKALVAALAETERRMVAQKKVVEDAEAQTVKAKGSAAAANAAAGKLRARLDALKVNTAASAASSPGAGEAGGLADLLATCADRYRGVAEAADRAIIAGLACANAYEALSKPAKE